MSLREVRPNGENKTEAHRSDRVCALGSSITPMGLQANPQQGLALIAPSEGQAHVSTFRCTPKELRGDCEARKGKTHPHPQSQGCRVVKSDWVPAAEWLPEP